MFVSSMDVRGIRSPDCALNVSHVLSRLAEHGSIATALSEGGTEIRTSPPAVYSESLMQRRGINYCQFLQAYVFAGVGRRALLR